MLFSSYRSDLNFLSPDIRVLVPDLDKSPEEVSVTCSFHRTFWVYTFKRMRQHTDLGSEAEHASNRHYGNSIKK